MKSILSLTICASLLGCVSAPDTNPYALGIRLLNSGKHHEAFLFWPTWEEWAKGIAGEGRNAHYLLIFMTTNYGQKDWVGIFKDPKISISLKYDLLLKIHDGAVGGRENGEFDCWDWDAIERTRPPIASFGTLEDEDPKGGNLHSKLLAYVEQSHSICDWEVAWERKEKFERLLDALRISKSESELPSIFMDSRVPVSIKAHLILLLHIDGSKKIL